MIGELIENPAAFDDDNDDVELLYRKNEMQDILNRFSSPAHSQNILLSGPSGVGKSLFATKILDELEARAGIKRSHVNCLGKTTAAIYREILEDLDGGPDAVPKTRSLEKLRQDLIDLGDHNLVVVLDEGDDLPFTDAVDDLLLQTDASIIAIAHDGQDWLSQIDYHHIRRFSHTEMERYSVDQLAHILELRAREGFFRLGVVSDEQLEYVANDVAGIARKGIQWLRAAAVVAQERGHEFIREDDLEDGKERAWRQIRQHNLESLPFHHRFLYALIHEGGESVSADALHDRYDAIAEQVYDGVSPQPIGRRARRTKLQKLESYHLIEHEGPTRDRVYWAADRDVEPRQIDLPATVS